MQPLATLTTILFTLLTALTAAPLAVNPLPLPHDPASPWRAHLGRRTPLNFVARAASPSGYLMHIYPTAADSTWSYAEPPARIVNGDDGDTDIVVNYHKRAPVA